jgi:hypothetical protein
MCHFLLITSCKKFDVCSSLCTVFMASLHLKQSECYWIGDLSLVEYDGEALAEWDAEGAVMFKMGQYPPRRFDFPCPSGKLGVLNLRKIVGVNDVEGTGVYDGCTWTNHEGWVGMIDGKLVIMEAQ